MNSDQTAAGTGDGATDDPTRRAPSSSPLDDPTTTGGSIPTPWERGPGTAAPLSTAGPAGPPPPAGHLLDRRPDTATPFPGSVPVPPSATTIWTPPAHAATPAPHPPARQPAPPPAIGQPGGGRPPAGYAAPPTQHAPGTRLDAPTVAYGGFQPPPRGSLDGRPRHFDLDQSGADDVVAPQAYSAVNPTPEAQSPHLGPGIDAQEESVSAPVQSTATHPAAPRINRTAIWAFVLSFLGITSPIGLFLGFRAKRQISQTREYGSPFATVAIVLGVVYIVVIVVAIVSYLAITGF
ncbi:MAG: DUF4190 domain-containing protein [Gordonia sp. (in: high G+C Gram-positive bacteria)]